MIAIGVWDGFLLSVGFNDYLVRIRKRLTQNAFTIGKIFLLNNSAIIMQVKIICKQLVI